MSLVSLAQRAESARAHYRARAALRLGDKVCVGRCGGGRATFMLSGWDGYWMVGKSGGCDYAPSAIVSVNGTPTSFLDPAWERYDPKTGLPLGEHGTSAEAMRWAMHEGDRITEVDDVEVFLQTWMEGGAADEWPDYYRWLVPLPAEAKRRSCEARSIDLLFGRQTYAAAE